MEWQFNNLVVVAGIAGMALAYFIAWINAKRNLAEAKIVMEQKFSDDIKNVLLEYKSSTELSDFLELRYKEGYQAGAAEAISEYKKSEGYEALLSVEHSKGKQLGIDEERNRWQLSYTPIIISNGGFLSHTIETGFEMQIFYAGFPINDPLKRITGFYKKSKDENIHKFFNLAEKAVDAAASIGLKNNIPITINTARQEKSPVNKN